MGVELRVKSTTSTAKEWKKIPIPSTTGSFNFSQTGQNILITYRDGKSGVLAKIVLNEANKLTEIYRSELGLAFPSEISPENYLVQAVTRITPNGYPIHKWKNVTPTRAVVNVGEEFGSPYSNVNLVGESGFFIVTDDLKGTDRVRTFALPKGSAPNIGKYLASETINLSCDRTLSNCIQVNRYLDERGYFFKLKRLFNSEECELQGFPRWSYRVSMTTDGKHALVISSENTQTRPAFSLLSFTGNGCTNFIKTTQEF